MRSSCAKARWGQYPFECCQKSGCPFLSDNFFLSYLKCFVEKLKDVGISIGLLFLCFIVVDRILLHSSKKQIVLLVKGLIIAYLGLILVNKGNVIPLGKGLRIIKKSKLDLKIEANSYIPCENILDALIHLVIYKRELFNTFIEHENDYPVWEDEVVAPILDIMKTISKIYKV